MTLVYDINFKYRGAEVEGYATFEEDYSGGNYVVDLNNHVQFTIHCDDNEDWIMLRENGADRPNVDPELVDRVVKHIVKLRNIA